MHADLHGAHLVRADLSSSFAIGANLSASDLRQASLRNAILRSASLEFANLKNGVLEGADLQGARLEGADLSNARFGSSDLTGARVGRTIFIGVDFSAIKGLRAVRHDAPSPLSSEELTKSKGKVPAEFLRGCGLSDWEIEAAKLHDPRLSSSAITSIAYEVDRLRGEGRALLFSSGFISYSHSDEAFARRLHSQLQDYGIRCWLDQYELRPGDRILDVVDKAIRVHDRVLLCCSKTSLNSWWVKDEIEKALERERQECRDIIIPLNLDGYLLDGWESGQSSTVRSRLAADFTGWEQDNAKFEREFKRVVKALRTNESPQKTAHEPWLSEER